MDEIIRKLKSSAEVQSLDCSSVYEKLTDAYRNIIAEEIAAKNFLITAKDLMLPAAAFYGGIVNRIINSSLDANPELDHEALSHKVGTMAMDIIVEVIAMAMTIRDDGDDDQ